MDSIRTFIDSMPSKTVSIVLIVIGALILQYFLKLVLSQISQVITRQDLFKTSRDREKRIKTVNGIINATVALTVWFIAAIMVMGVLNIPIAPLLTSAGLIGAALAFGSQSLIKDFVSGLFIIAENQYRVDDYVEIGTIKGTVDSLSVRTTTIKGDDGSIHVIANGSITATTNKSFGLVREEVKLNLAGSTDLSKFATLLTSIAEDIKNDDSLSNLIKDGPVISHITEVTKNSIVVTVEIKVQAKKRTEATSALWRKLEEAAKKKQVSFA
jgi:moderate conductance mechanosensitive channel